MATPAKSPRLPPQCYVRSAISRLESISHDLNRSLTVCTVWANQGNVKLIQAECSILRAKLQHDIGAMTDTLEGALKQISNTQQRYN